MSGNVTPIGAADPRVRRAIQLATERLVRTHLEQWKKFLRDELRRTNDGNDGGAA